MNQKFKTIGLLTLLFVGVLMAVATVSALPLTIDSVKINGDSLVFGDTNRLSLERGQDLTVSVRFTPQQDIKNVEIEALISGYEFSAFERIVDATPLFDADANVSYVKRLTLKLPDKADEDDYLLRIRVLDRNGAATEQDYRIRVDVPRHDVTIKDVVFNPDNRVQAGRALLTVVRLKNMGDKTEQGIKIKVSVPMLGISASDYIDELKKDESTTSEELYLRIPTCAAPGSYDVKVTVEYSEGYKTTSSTKSIEVVSGDSCQIVPKPEDQGGKPTTITYVAVSQDVSAGGPAVMYPITITNNDVASKTYILSVDGVSSWGKATLSPSNVVTLNKGETQTVYVSVSANSDTQAGERVFVVSVRDASGATLKDLSLKANVTQTGTSLMGLKRALEIGLIALVVLLVLIALIVAFTRMRGSDSEESGQTYY